MLNIFTRQERNKKCSNVMVLSDHLFGGIFSAKLPNTQFFTLIAPSEMFHRDCSRNEVCFDIAIFSISNC